MMRRLLPALAMAIPIVLGGQPAPLLDAFGGLEPGPHGVGYRIIAAKDSTRPAPFSTERTSALDVTVHLWYPTATIERCLTFGDYIARESGPIGAGGLEPRLREGRERFAGMVGSFRDSAKLTDDAWIAISSARMRGCDAPSLRPAPGRHPVLVGRFLGGLWTIQAEYFASHGYVVALVVAPGGVNMGAVRPEDRPRVIGRQIEQQARDLDVLVSVLMKEPSVDLSRIGVLAQAHAPILFAMQRPGWVKAVAIQDGALFGGGMSSQGARRSASWNPSGLTGALLITESLRDSTPQPYAADFDLMSAVYRYRLRFETPLDGHDDISSAGYVARRALRAGALHGSRVTAFEANVRAQHLFFDAWVRDAAGRREQLDMRFPTVVPTATATLEITPGRMR